MTPSHFTPLPATAYAPSDRLLDTFARDPPLQPHSAALCDKNNANQRLIVKKIIKLQNKCRA